MKNLLNGTTKSCGCYSRDSSKVRFARHRMHGTRVYRIWANMKRRCVGNAPGYGDRGIKVCKRWKDFANFFADMGEPQPNQSIDRINNDGDYSPENCRWATAREQQRNKRTSRFVVFQGQRMNLEDAAAKSGLRPTTVAGRLKLGWSEHDALTIPPKATARWPKAA